MKQWIKINRWKILLSCLLTLLPILVGIILWDWLPDSMATHWGADGNIDGFSTKAFAVFGLPIIICVLNLVCFIFTLLDKNSREQNGKAMGIIFWIMPCLSLVVNGVIYSVALGKEFSVELLIPVIIGILFVAIGNYMPKVKQNRTLGIKLPWTFQNEENWNKTHRLGGKLWVLGGILILLSVCLPFEATVWVFVTVLLLMIAIPFAYSYSLYRNHLKQGISYSATSHSKRDAMIMKVSMAIVAIILAGISVVMFTGKLSYTCQEDSLYIQATYWNDIQIDYAEIEEMEYRAEKVDGIRKNGFGSFKFSLGIFENREFGNYIRYTYNTCDSCVVLKGEGEVLVLSGKTPEETEELYNQLKVKLEQ